MDFSSVIDFIRNLFRREDSNSFEKLEKEMKVQTKKLEEALENENNLKKIQEIIEFKSEKDEYFLDILEKFDNVDDYIKELTKPLPENVSKINLEEGFSQYLIDSNLKNENNLYNYFHESINELINSTRYLWENLKVSNPITENEFLN